jgi:tyrosyl-tRNA synthetase
VIVGDKMSKSLDNYVGLAEPPEQQLGKLMSISDDLMWRYYELLSERSLAEIAATKQAVASGSLHPKTAKMDLAKELVRRFHDGVAADEAERKWEAQFSRREIPEDIHEVVVSAEGAEGVGLAKALVEAALVPSTSEGRRRIKAGAVEIDGAKVRDEKARLATGGPYVVKAGKRAWARVVVR